MKLVMVILTVLILYLIIIFINLSYRSTRCHFSNPAIKIAILIISIETDSVNTYNIQKKIWKKYLKSNPNLDCYFIECRKNIKSPKIIGSKILSPCEESYIPGIYQKTIESLNLLKNKYDFYIRTNLNSFVIFTHLINFLNHLDTKTPIYTGDYSDRSNWVCGNSIILNKAACQILIKKGKNPKYFYNTTIADDVLIGKVFNDAGIYPHKMKKIVYWMTQKLSSSEFQKGIDIVNSNKYPFIRTNPFTSYNDEIYYQKFMNKLLTNYYLN